MLYGEPRLTVDIDLIVFFRADDIARLSEAYPMPDFYVPPSEVISAEAAREQKGQFNVLHIASSLKADFHIARRDEFHAWAFRNVHQYPIGDHMIRLAPPEYVIVRKLEYFREGGSEKHLRDIRAILNVSRDTINQDDLDFWIQRCSVQAQWKMVNP